MNGGGRGARISFLASDVRYWGCQRPKTIAPRSSCTCSCRRGEGSVEDLAALVGASTASVRRDLIRLKERGLVNRTHGGAEVAGKMGYAPFRFDAAFPLREARFADEKRRIALAAAAMVAEGDTIVLSPGTTTTQIARSLLHRKGIHILTSAVNIGMELSSLPNI